MPRRVFITVAEVSGDRHAAQLVQSLRQLDPDIIIEGLGGPDMAAAGAIIHRNTVAKAAMGWRGALRALEVYKLLRWTRRHFEEHRPDLVVGVDSPSMNFHFAKIARQMRIPALQYVAPQLWAWAPWRMRKLRKWVDQVACILPFEEAYFRAHGVPATFVGHPLFDELPEERSASKAHTNGHPPTVGLLAGSRKSEAQHNFPGMLEIAHRLMQEFPGIRFLVPTTPATHPIVEQLLRGSANAGLASSVEVSLNRFDEMVPRCDFCLTVSGTATLHVASFGVPMIVVYRINPFVWHAGGKWIVRTRTFALVNVLGKQSPADIGDRQHIVPEFVPWIGSTAPVAELAIDMLRHPEKLQVQRDRLSQLVHTLDHPGASMNVAKLAMQMMNQSIGDSRAPESAIARQR